MRQKFPACYRLLSACEFDYVFTHSTYQVRSKEFLMLSIENSLKYHRLGLVIGKKSIRLAIDRNTVKRLIRENFRTRIQMITEPLDIVFLSKRGIDPSNKKCLQASLMTIFRTLKHQVDSKQS